VIELTGRLVGYSLNNSNENSTRQIHQKKRKRNKEKKKEIILGCNESIPALKIVTVFEP
jgi:hypothetical protein